MPASSLDLEQAELEQRPLGISVLSTYSQFHQTPNRDPAAKTPTVTSLRLLGKGERSSGLPALKVIDHKGQAEVTGWLRAWERLSWPKLQGDIPNTVGPRAQRWRLTEKPLSGSEV